MARVKHLESTFLSKRIIVIAVAGVLSLAGGPAVYAGISATPHNLSSTGPGPNVSDKTEICVFCHTPHGSETTAAVPLWNKKLADPTGYTTYDQLGTSTLDGDVLQIGSVSLACLSCHDGTQALDTVLNAPGSGGFNPAGASFVTTWTAGSGNIGTGIANIGQDLKNDHPVGVQYGGFEVTPGTKIDEDFTSPLKMAGKDLWWVDTSDPAGTVGSRDKRDMILYTRLNTVNGNVNQPFVECASCHDPHSSDNNTFLRISNTSSGVCVACHTK